jgi:CheY-like chemotaxis protein
MPIKTILLIEDNPDDRELMRLAFARINIQHNLISVSDGMAALNYLSSNDSRRDRSFIVPSLILLDLNLPKFNGIEVVRRIRANYRTKFIPIVIISSSTEPQDIIDSYSSGCNSYIRKPIGFARLQNIVEQIANYWLTVNQLPSVLGANDG